MPRLVAISDTHFMHKSMPALPEGDVLIHCGDWSGRGTLAELDEFVAWLKTLASAAAQVRRRCADYAEPRPEYNHFAVDILPVVVRYATRRANQRGLSNVRVAVIGGRELLRDYVAAGTVTEIHCYHPQPYYEPREIGLRLITPEFLALVHRSLVPGGLFIVQTDNPAYARYMRLVLPAPPPS